METPFPLPLGRFKPSHTHFHLHERVKARLWGKSVASLNALPLPDHLRHLSDEELTQRGHRLVTLDGKRYLQIFTHKHE